MPITQKISAYCRATLVIILVCIASSTAFAGNCLAPGTSPPSLAKDTIAKILGWVQTGENRCGGYYLEPAFNYPDDLLKENLVQIYSNQPFTFSRRGTSTFEGKVTVSRYGQQITADKAYLYRDPNTGKLSAIDLMGDVHLREPNSLIVAKKGHFDIKNREQSLMDILYRTAIYPDFIIPITTPTNKQLQKDRKIYQLSAWGRAAEFSQKKAKEYEFSQASYSTCPPLTNVWMVKASHITLDKNSGTGTAKNARLLIKGLPIVYTPILSFPIDHKRKTGFLFPKFGSNSSGAYFEAPFYWNIAPNYDSTITPIYLAKRGFEIDDLTRYMHRYGDGQFKIGILPNDQEFKSFQNASREKYQSSTDTVTQANLRTLLDASPTRKSFTWQDNMRFNEHWATSIDYNYVSDDYYIKNLSNNLNVAAQNQLLQQAEITYQGQYWNFAGRFQGYQTVHPIDEITFINMYTRSPQLVLNGMYPDERTGLEFFIDNEATHFDIRNTPGIDGKMPIGNRYNTQPGISFPINYPAFFITPRAQFAATKYEIGHVDNQDSKTLNRALPIFDLHSGLYFDRNFSLFGTSYRQTLEPQIYYTYVPYRNQTEIPVFDTIVNMLTYDQLFIYNRFSGIDRIGDANQISAGIATRVIDSQNGLEKIYLGVGEIYYFENRRVTLCNNPEVCFDNPENPANKLHRSPISGTFTYNLNPTWGFTANTIWNSQSHRLDNQTATLQFHPAERKLINLGYVFVRGGDSLPADPVNSPDRNLQLTDVSVAWPVSRDWSTTARWTQNWNHGHFQNFLYGLQYDSCCWAVRFVTGRAYVGITPANTYQYNTQFYLQFSLKGLGNVGTSDPTGYLSTNISGYQDNFGRDF